MGRRAGTLVLTAAMLAAGAALSLGPVDTMPPTPSPMRLPWAVLAALFAAAVLLRVQVQTDREVHSITLVDLPLVLGLFLVDPLGLVVARLVGSVPALLHAWHARRRPAARRPGRGPLFDASLALLEASVAVVVFDAVLGGDDPSGTPGMVATFTAVLAADLLSATLVMTATRLEDGVVGWRPVVRALVTGAVAAITTTSLALVAVVVLIHNRQVAWLLLVVTGILFLAYRAYASLREQHEWLDRLHRFSRVVGGGEQSGPVVTAAILTQARDLLRADRAELTLFTADRARVRTTLGPSATPGTTPVTDQAAALALLRRSLAADGALLRTGDVDDPRLRQALADDGVRDALVVPLRDASGPIGTLLVADRAGEAAAFGGQDLRLLQTLAGHAGVALERSRLIDELRREVAEREHQALHDGLTGLANRALFQERVRQAIAALGPNASLAVLLVDLDRFKEVNDTLGHHTGDLVLREVGMRLERSLPDSHAIARLGGDEFAVLVPAVPDREAARAVGRMVRSVLEQPLATADLELRVAGSVGIALCPEHGADPGLLLQRADVAMYHAKAAHSGLEVYAAERDQYSPRRLALFGELRAAIERGALQVVYQPKAELPAGRVVGFEALLRWLDPTHGLVPPDEFVPIAETTGLITPMSRYVLQAAVEQVGAWRDQGAVIGMSVNLSVRNLLEPGLVDRVDRLLAGVGVPPGLLTLELTEGAVMTDPEATIAVLHQLSGAGVRLAIDDFGTGYSSLAYLKRLPVDEVKLDKAFVMGMTVDADDEAIVSSTIELAHNLGLRIVAEGVEDHETWEALAALGCELAQGHYVAPPMPAEQATAWLREHRAEEPTPERPDRFTISGTQRR
jgi:diguanylate cyclase (GGDEF)-like protein